jgi:hypothetical protein
MKYIHQSSGKVSETILKIFHNDCKISKSVSCIELSSTESLPMRSVLQSCQEPIHRV